MGHGIHRGLGMAALIGLAATAAHAAPGDPLTPTITVASGLDDLTTSPALVASDAAGNFFVGWGERDTGHPGPGYRSYVAARGYSASGVPDAPAFRLNTWQPSVLSLPPFAIAVDGTGALVAAWQTEWNIVRAARARRTGTVLSQTEVVNEPPGTYGPRQCDSLAVGGSKDGAFVVAWRCAQATFSGGSSALRFRTFRTNGEPVGDVQGFGSGVPTSTLLLPYVNDYTPRLAVDDNGNFAIAWERVHATSTFPPVEHPQILTRSLGPFGVPLGVETVVADGSAGLDQIGMANLGNYVVSRRLDAGGIELQTYDIAARATGTPVANAAERLLCTDGDGDMVVGRRTAAGQTVQWLYKDGRVRSTVVTLPDTAAARGVSVACDQSGDIVVAWVVDRVDNGQYRFDQFVRRFRGP